MFQFLLGRLETRKEVLKIYLLFVFQFLLGRLETNKLDTYPSCLTCFNSS